MYEKAKREVEQTIKQTGEHALIDAGVNSVHPEIVKLIGKLRYRTSYGQNVLNHSLEVSYIAGLMAAELGTDVKTAQVDADSVEQLVELFGSYKPDLVMNLALPYQDLTIMEACLQTGCNYLDTANYEPKDEAHFEYSWQWAYREKFEKAGITAVIENVFETSPQFCLSCQ